MKSLRILFVLWMAALPLLLSAQTFVNYTTADGLPSDVVNGVAIDDNNNVWVATDEGVAMFDGTTWTVYTTANGLIDNYILCIAVDANNQIWAGTDLGVCKYSGGTWTNYTTADGLVYNMISYIASDHTTGVWIGTGEGVSHYNGTTFTNYTTANGLPGNMISYIYDDPQGDVWIGTWLTGLVRFDGTTFTTYTYASANLMDDNILCVTVDSEGKKWIGSYKGITVLDANNQWLINYRDDCCLYRNYVQDMAFDDQGILWVGIYVDYLQEGGITMFTNNAWTTFTMDNGLVSEQVKRIAIDQDNFIWIATGNGLSKLKVNNIGFDETNPAEFTIYPNPAGNELHLKIDVQSAEFRMFDVSGRLVLEETLQNSANTVSLDGIDPGSYIVELRNGEDVAHSRVLVK